MKRLGTATLVVAVFTALLSSTAGGWSNVYGTDGVNDYSSAEAVELLPDGSAIVAGCFDGEFDGKVATNGLDTFVMKLSPEGETLWTHTEDGLHENDCLDMSIRIDDSGNVFAQHVGAYDQGSDLSLSDEIIALAPDGEPLSAVLPGLNFHHLEGPETGFTDLYSIPGIRGISVSLRQTATNRNGTFAQWEFDSVKDSVVLWSCQIEDCETATETEISQVPALPGGYQTVKVDVTSNDTIVLAANYGTENAHVTLCLAGDCVNNRRDFSVPVANSAGYSSSVSIEEYADGTPSIVLNVSTGFESYAVVVSCANSTCTSLNQNTVNLGSESSFYLTHAVDSAGLITLLSSGSASDPVVLDRCADVSCTSVSTTTLDRTGYSEQAAFDTNDNLVYWLDNGNNQMLVRCANSACSNSSAVSADSHMWYPTEIVVDDAGIVYVGGGENIERCSTSACEQLNGWGLLVDATSTGYTLINYAYRSSLGNYDHYLTRFDFGDCTLSRDWSSSRQLISAADGFTVLSTGQCRNGQDGPTAINVNAAGEEVWAWQPTYPAEYGISDYNVELIRNMSRSDGNGGLIVVARHTPSLTYKQTDLAVYRIGADGTELWSTLINGSCVGGSDWSFISGGTIVLNAPSCAQSDEQAARVLSLETGAVITEYDEATLRGDSMLIAPWPGSDCFEVNEAKTLVVFSYDRCDSDLPDLNGMREWSIPMQYSVDEFADLGDGRVAALVDLYAYELSDETGNTPGRWFGVFEVVADGFLRPLKFEQIVSTNGENDSLRDVAVDPVSGRVVVVGRVAGASSVSLSPLSRSRSLQLQSSSLPNALTVSASSEVVPISPPSTTVPPSTSVPPSTTVPGELEPHGFEDVPTEGWRNDAVAWLRQSGVTKGCSATSFCPDEEMTRAQQLTFLWRYAGEPSAGPVSPFTDVPRGQYFSVPVDWAFNTNVTKGISQDPWLFGTTQSVTRAQAVTFLWRQAGEPEPSGPPTFGDVPAGQFFTDAVAWAAENNVTKGRNPDEFDPHAPVTRVEFAAFLSRYDDLNLN